MNRLVGYGRAIVMKLAAFFITAFSFIVSHLRSWWNQKDFIQIESIENAIKQWQCRSALILIAHPDDEIFCAGLLVLLEERKIPFTIACLTSGGGARGFPSPASAIETRKREMINCVNSFANARLIFLEQEDIGIQGVDHFCFENVCDFITQHEFEHEFDLIVTHGADGEYGHPAHRWLSKVVTESIAKMSRKPRLAYMCAWKGFQPDWRRLNPQHPATHRLEGDAVEEGRQRILASHASQATTLNDLGFSSNCLDRMVEWYHVQPR